MSGQFRRLRRAGFTLLEVLITLGAMAFLMAALWSLFGTYAKLFDAGRTKAGATQLIGGLVQQITDDLRNAVSDAVPSPPGAAPGTVRRFALFGDAHTLQIDVCQTTWPRAATASFASGGGSYDVDPELAPQAHELRTVRYWFVDPTAAEQSGGELRGGLSRREFPFEAPSEAALDATQLPPPQQPDDSSSAVQPSSDGMDETPPPELAILEQTPVDYQDDRVTWVPEALRLEFRYFDGTTWSSVWSSLARKSLPLAVEITIDFQAVDELPKPADDTGAPNNTATSANTGASANTGVGSSADSAADLYAPDDAPVLLPGVVSRRVVVYLPQSPLRAAVDAAAMGGADSGDTGDMSAADPTAALDPAAQLVAGATADEDEQMMNDPLFTSPAPNTGSDYGRFRFSRRGSGGASDGAATLQTAADQWLRVGP